ncbi:hypothetical protein EMIHUDRAFT_218022 [Emiliania huxleyi CCMP1516]|uniref:U-box domain-containing protein n=2 Tax=Emiliania huxleyi TaxID=2903 RepID=A0A0D3I9Q5_EMIH1|nr:hypothetical protein EMIHUDRAFT_218022 [Emiliania huxleyi CCMP1516]EOD07990.1 hypothetical protein EMIHUDRAFT_218022 [Emiliania huxleyi CCMP1516]|eukprot:XP_005760419.1 hypothetical protein EMIHUDRAFT_218022 [Emiliania huxleyi CCMP1516]
MTLGKRARERIGENRSPGRTEGGAPGPRTKQVSVFGRGVQSLTCIGSSAFSCCDSLTSVTLPAGLLSIEDGAFHRCSSLTNVTVPTTAEIGDKAFEPTTTVVMSDPVMAADGHSYERKQIERWLATKSTSPR